MLEGAVMEYAKWLMSMIVLTFITLAVIFMFKLNEINSFQQEVNYHIERHGGLTESAMIELNELAKDSYGGCLVVSSEDGAACLFEGDRNRNAQTSGFFVREYKEYPDGTKVYYDRADSEAAVYGTPIRYALTRQIGTVAGGSYLKPGVTGKSASRIRGVALE